MIITGDTVGTIYVICFASTPLRHACHYTGWTLDLEARLALHRRGRGSSLMAAVERAGICWVLAGSWPGTPNDEHALKRLGTARQWCPACRPDYLAAKARAQASRRAAAVRLEIAA